MKINVISIISVSSIVQGHRESSIPSLPPNTMISVKINILTYFVWSICWHFCLQYINHANFICLLASFTLHHSLLQFLNPCPILFLPEDLHTYSYLPLPTSTYLSLIFTHLLKSLFRCQAHMDVCAAQALLTSWTPSELCTSFTAVPKALVTFMESSHNEDKYHRCYAQPWSPPPSWAPRIAHSLINISEINE